MGTSLSFLNCFASASGAKCNTVFVKPTPIRYAVRHLNIRISYFLRQNKLFGGGFEFCRGIDSGKIRGHMTAAFCHWFICLLSIMPLKSLSNRSNIANMEFSCLPEVLPQCH